MFWTTAVRSNVHMHSETFYIYTVYTKRDKVQPMSGKFQDWMYCKPTRNIWPVMFQTVNQDVLEMCTATFTWQHSTSLPWVVGNREVLPLTPQCTSEVNIIYQRIFVSTSNHTAAECAIFYIFVNLQFFLIPTTEMNVDRPSLCWHLRHSDGCDKTALQHFIKCLPELLQQHLKWCTDARGNYFKGDPWHKSVSTPYSFLYHQSWNVWTLVVLHLNISHTHMLTYIQTPHTRLATKN